jgi:hypothetical protein
MIDRPIDRFTDDEERSWIWQEDADRAFPVIPPRALQWWIEHYCRWLGKKLDVNYRMVPGTRRQRQYERRYVLEDELRKIVNAIAANKPFQSEADDDDTIPWPQASKISGLSKWELFRGHRRGCCLLGGKKLWSEKLLITDKRGRLFPIRHYSQKEMVTIAEEAKRRRESIQSVETHSDPIVAGYLSRTQFEAEFSDSYDSLRYHWDISRKKRGLRGGIKTKQVRGPGKGKSKLTYSRRKDTEKVVNERQVPSQLERAKGLLKEWLKDGPVRFTEIIKRGRLHDLSEKALRRGKRALKVCATQRGYQSPCYWHFREDLSKVPLAVPTPQQRPLREKAIVLIRKAMAEGATRFCEVKRLGLKDGISEGSMYLAWKEVQETPDTQLGRDARVNDDIGIRMTSAYREGGDTVKDGRRIDPGCKYMELLGQICGNTEKILCEVPKQTAELVHRRLAESTADAAFDRPATSRLVLDLATCSAVFDGVQFDNIDTVPLKLLEALLDAGEGQVVSGEKLRSLPQMRGKNLTREFGKLPEELRTIVDSEGGKGYWLHFPPLNCQRL